MYQQDWLYEWCDANGLLIWQEVMAACNPYPLTQELMREVRSSVVRREKAVQGDKCNGVLQGEQGDWEDERVTVGRSWVGAVAGQDRAAWWYG